MRRFPSWASPARKSQVIRSSLRSRNNEPAGAKRDNRSCAKPAKRARDFAVVANEVKELAKQTAKATEDISQKIAAIQTDTKGASTRSRRLAPSSNQLNDISTTIATAVEEQSATTNEMSGTSPRPRKARRKFRRISQAWRRRRKAPPPTHMNR